MTSSAPAQLARVGGGAAPYTSSKDVPFGGVLGKRHTWVARGPEGGRRAWPWPGGCPKGHKHGDHCRRGRERLPRCPPRGAHRTLKQCGSTSVRDTVSGSKREAGGRPGRGGRASPATAEVGALRRAGGDAPPEGPRGLPVTAACKAGDLEKLLLKCGAGGHLEAATLGGFTHPPLAWKDFSDVCQKQMH